MNDELMIRGSQVFRDTVQPYAARWTSSAADALAYSEFNRIPVVEDPAL